MAVDSTKGLDIDKITMSSELWYLRDYKNDYTPFSYTIPAKGANLPSNVIEVLPFTVPENSLVLAEVQDVGTSGRWYEVQQAVTLPINTASYSALVTPLVRGTSGGIGIWRPSTGASGLPSYQITINIRTFIPPFTT